MRTCEEIREALEDGLRDGVAEHLLSCEDCRRYRDGLAAVRAGLAALPAVPFPDEALEEVWARTLRSGRRQRYVWFATAAAAVLVSALLVVLFRSEPAHTPAEVAQAEREARIALALTARAIRRTERVAFERVFSDEVSPALRRIPIRWSDPLPPSRRTRT